MILPAIAGLILVVLVLVDGFETIVIPRTVKRSWRAATLLLTASRPLYSGIGRLQREDLRQSLLAGFAPILLATMIALWAVLLILGFALIQYGLQTPMHDPTGHVSFVTDLYFSGVTFFTLGFGDVVPANGIGRALAVWEAGTGFGFLALVIGYFPVIYSGFSRREVRMLLLDSKAGSSPTASELLKRHAERICMRELGNLLKDWELFAAELLESYLSYPLLAYYRSQHDHQSWLNSLTAIMDACALIEAGFEGEPDYAYALRYQAQNTFAMARHLVVDLAYVLDCEPVDTCRMTEAQYQSIVSELHGVEVPLDSSPAARARLQEICDLYEPYVQGLSQRLNLPLPEWIPAHRVLDNWQISAWDRRHFSDTTSI